MTSGHQILGAPHIMSGGQGSQQGRIRRLNRLPLAFALGLVVLVLATVIFGLSSRGLWRKGSGEVTIDDRGPASTFPENLKRGVGDGVIGENPEPPTAQPPMDAPRVIAAPTLDRPLQAEPKSPTAPQASRPGLEPDQWRERLQREHEEQILNERHRQTMARLQRADGARASPMRIDTAAVAAVSSQDLTANSRVASTGNEGLNARLIAAAEALGMSGSGQRDQNGQRGKQAFLNVGVDTLPNGGLMAEPVSPLTLSRGSVIPAILLTGINADLPGRILAQVSQNVFDSATGQHLLIPQGSRLVGRYDSKVSFGQSRVLVVWTDIVLANGQSLAIGAMAGVDQAGQAGFKDKVHRHLWQSFGSAALIAILGTGMDLALPDGPGTGSSDPSDAARRSFSETFGRLAERTISKNIDVQPTLTIRPGYRFNILVDRDLVFGGQDLERVRG
ncbi:MAG: IncP-type conjugal transfer protein TrbI [Allorhizobium sp.]